MKSLVSYWTPCQTIVNVLQTIEQISRFIIPMYFKPCLPTNKLHDACIFRYTRQCHHTIFKSIKFYCTKLLCGGPASSTNNSSLQRGWGRTWSRCQQRRDQRGSCFKCRNWLIHIWWKTMLWNAPKHTHAHYCFFSSDTSLDTKKGLQPTYFESRW